MLHKPEFDLKGDYSNEHSDNITGKPWGKRSRRLPMKKSMTHFSMVQEMAGERETHRQQKEAVLHFRRIPYWKTAF